MADNMREHPILELRGVSKSFGGVHALDNVDLSIRKGEIHSLAGENGSGKSTLIKIISGVYRPDAGTVAIDGALCQSITPITAINLGIQVIYQDFSIFPNLTVRENIAVNSEIQSHRKIVNRRRMREIAEKAVERIGFKIDLEEKVGELSVADKQLVAISRAMLHSAKLIILDEPTTALTRREVDKLFSIIKRLQNEGIAILFVSHKTDEVFEIAQNYTILRSGKKVASGEVQALSRENFAYHMTGRRFVYENMGRSVQSEVFVQVRNLTRKGSFYDISFDVRRGEIVCIAGLLGSGRTELAQALFGVHPADSGFISVGGKKARVRTVQQAMARQVGYVPEDRLSEGLFLQQSIYLNQIVSNIKKHTGPLNILRKENLVAEAGTWVKNLKVNTADISREVSTLSGGNQQKVILGRWLSTGLKVLILNGPTVGVDIGAKFDIHRLLRNLSDGGMSIIMISDDIAEILACSDRALIMKYGRIAGEFVTKETDEATINRAMFADL